MQHPQVTRPTVKYTFLSLSAALLSVAAVACGNANNPDNPNPTNPCPAMSQGQDLPECTALYDSEVAIKLQPDMETQAYGAIGRGGTTFFTASGKKLKLSSSVTEAIMRMIDDGKRLYANLVYRATVANGEVTALEPELRVTEDAILNHVFAGKSLVGKISPFTADGTYSFDTTLPVVIQFDEKASNGAIPGQIVNADSSAVVSDGTCVAALPTDKSNPLANGFTKNIVVTRVPSMHAQFDDELVLAWTESSSGMGSEFYPSVATLLGQDGLSKTWNVSQHGTPNSGPALELQFGAGSAKSGPC